jgi:hypothetical protein
MKRADASICVVACGALAREIVALQRLNGWSSVAVECLPPELHNRPEQIPDAVQTAIRAARKQYSRIFVAYADCGTGGLLDRVLQEEGVERIPGAHCYEFFATSENFRSLSNAEPGTFYLTDFLVRHFDRLVIEGLGLDRHPQLLHEYFRNYRRLIHLAQVPDAGLTLQARAAAARLGLAFEERFTGYGTLAASLRRVVTVPLASVLRRGSANNPATEQGTWPQ